MSSIEIVSLEFLILTLVTLTVYYLIPPRPQLFWLLAVSYFFYATWSVFFCAILFFFTIINFVLARRIEKSKSRWLFSAGIATNAGSLILLKLISSPYGSVILESMHTGEVTALLLPIGFSFYVLQTISYLTDVFRGQLKAEDDFIHFALYLAYFPKMLAGPIERAKSFLPQLKRERVVGGGAMEQGLYLILLGLLRKMVIADHLSALRPTDIFSSPENYTSLERLAWLFIFGFTLYNDFAGYTSIVRGVSRLIGIQLSPNFRQPFLARSFSDFWTRWHISLSTWLRDYIFYPVRRWLMSARSYRWLVFLMPPLLTMLVSGLWHGAYLAILAWGLVHGLYLVIEQLLQQYGLLPKKDGWKARVYGMFVFIFITLAWIPFNTASVRGTGRYLATLRPPHSAGFDILILPDIFLLLLLSAWMDWQEHRYADSAFPRKWSPAVQAWGTAIAILLLIIFASTSADLSRFVYQGGFGA